MIDAAERIVAEQGMPALTLRAVQEAAGQSNKSAVNYHFGSRDGLIAAILDDRMRPIAEQRRALLDAIDVRYGFRSAVADGAVASAAAAPLLRELTVALVDPLARRVFETPRSAYARFLAQSMVSPELAEIIARQATMFTVNETQQYMVRVLVAGRAAPGLDGDTAVWRANGLLGHVITALAAAEPHITGPRGRVITARIIDTCHGLLTAPVGHPDPIPTAPTDHRPEESLP